eukprot:scaffold1525_cov142-Cylindrotheca_fusiformis.AAC.141
MRPVENERTSECSSDDDDDTDDIPLTSLLAQQANKRSRPKENLPSANKPKLRKQEKTEVKGMNQPKLSFVAKPKSELEQHQQQEELAQSSLPQESLGESTNQSIPMPKDKEDTDKADAPGEDTRATAKPKSPRKMIRRRIVSEESEIEFVPDKIPKPPSLLSQLVHRSCRGTKLTPQQPKKWRTPSWVTLLQPPPIRSVESPSSMPPSRTIDHLAWDSMGVLLAVASGDWIRVYDWDMVRAADLHGRNDRRRKIRDSEFQIPPILQFRVPHPVASLEWNPHHPDQLAIGLRMVGHVHLYNLDRVSLWLSKKTRNAALCPPQHKTFVLLSHPRISGSASTILFLDAKTVLVSSGTMVYCYQQQQPQQQSFQLIWRYQPPAPATCASVLGSLHSSLVLLGTKCGHFCLLRWDQSTREGAFSSEHRPKVLHEWTPHAKLKQGILATTTTGGAIQSRRMGILKIMVAAKSKNNPPPTTTTISKSTTWGCCRISWVTTGGWVLSTELTSPTDRNECHISHTTPIVTYQQHSDSVSTAASNGKKKALNNGDSIKEWSQPQDPILVDKNFLCWSDVPAVTKILPHHNKYVLNAGGSGHTRIVRSKQRALLYRNSTGGGGTTHSIPLPENGDNEPLPPPQTLAIHPEEGMEWIVLGMGKRLVLLVGTR